jgi:mannose-6-phosphate isomerase-like protein (cupin superfamily)
MGQTEVKYVRKTWGSETWMVNGTEFCGKILRINPSSYCSLHWHRLKEENFYVMSGKVKLEYGDTIANLCSLVLSSGDSFLVPRGTLHRFTGLGPSEALVIETSTQHFDDDSVRIEPSCG